MRSETWAELEAPDMARPLVLTGFMGSGKSAVGRKVAAQLGWGFVDLDEVIEARWGCPITQIFAEEGEAVFRAAERALFQRLLQQPGLVIATGGGTLADPDSLALALKKARVVWLDAPFHVLLERIQGDAGRPLLAEGREALEGRMAAREPLYAQAHVRMDSSSGTVADVAEAVSVWLADHCGMGRIRAVLEVSLSERLSSKLENSTLTVPLGPRAYGLEFVRGGRHQLGERLRALFPKIRRAALISNARVDGLYGDDIRRSLAAAGIQAQTLLVPDSEDAKQLSVVGLVLGSLMEARFERQEPLIALGGGVIGDLVGFVASVYLRGVPFVQVPTTLLAQVDSSVGGKTGVNAPFGKNLVGSFYQPTHVLMDAEVLATLDREDLKAGLAEVVKYGAIRDLGFLQYLEEQVDSLLQCDVDVLEQVILRSCAHKAQVVVRDEREVGERALLNFGHTLGHVFEALGEFHGLKHGHAVAIGMIFAAQLSVALEGLPAEDALRLERLVRALELPVCAPTQESGAPVTVEACIERMTRDKKVSQGRVKFVVLERLGQAALRPLEFSEVAQVLERFLAVHS